MLGFYLFCPSRSPSQMAPVLTGSCLPPLHKLVTLSATALPSGPSSHRPALLSVPKCSLHVTSLRLISH